MSELIKTIFDVETNELEVRPMTNSELAQYEADYANAALEAKVKAEEEVKKQAAKAKLEALGLDADDLKALGLG
jgi:hypothetical protein